MESQEKNKESRIKGNGTKENPYTYRNAVITSPQEVIEKVAEKKWWRAKMGEEIFFKFDMEGRFYIRPHPNNDKWKIFAFKPIPTDIAGNPQQTIDNQKADLMTTAAVLFTA